MPNKTFHKLKNPKKQRVIDAICREFADNDYADVSIQDIIKRADIPRGSFYQYFEDKADAFIYCFNDIQSRILDLPYGPTLTGIESYFYLTREYMTSPENASWYEEAKSNLTEDEYAFLLSKKLLTVPDSVLILATENLCKEYLFPKHRELLAAEGKIKDPKDLAVFASLFAGINLLSTLFEKTVRLNGHQELWFCYQQAMQVLKAYYESRTLQAASSHPETASLLAQMLENINAFRPSRLRFYAFNGLDLTVCLSQYDGWHVLSDTSIGISIETNQISGQLSSELNGFSLGFGSESRTHLSLIAADGTAALCGIGSPEFPLTFRAPDMICIATNKEGKKLCLIDEGNYCSF